MPAMKVASLIFSRADADSTGLARNPGIAYIDIVIARREIEARCETQTDIIVPVVFECSAVRPMAVLLLPMVLERSAVHRWPC
jgi:hypothetical protein